LAGCSGAKKQDQSAQTPDSTAGSGTAEIQPQFAHTPAGNPIVILKTTRGDIEIEIFERESPNHGGNFIKLVKNGYYDGLVFHRVVPDVVIESGDPKGTGEGSPGYSLEPEKTSFLNKAGYIGMVGAADGKSNGSQFYILVQDNPLIDGRTSCFARVLNGMETVLAISKSPAQKERPIETVKILEAYLKPLPQSSGTDADDTSMSASTK